MHTKDRSSVALLCFTVRVISEKRKGHASLVRCRTASAHDTIEQKLKRPEEGEEGRRERNRQKVFFLKRRSLLVLYVQRIDQIQYEGNKGVHRPHMYSKIQQR